MGWWAYRQPLAQGRIVQQNAPWSTVALGGQVEGRAIARHHAASLLAIDQRRTPAIARDQLVEIGAHQGAAAAALGSNEDLQPFIPPTLDVQRGHRAMIRAVSVMIGRIAKSSLARPAARPKSRPCRSLFPLTAASKVPS